MAVKLELLLATLEKVWLYNRLLKDPCCDMLVFLYLKIALFLHFANEKAWVYINVLFQGRNAGVFRWWGEIG